MGRSLYHLPLAVAALALAACATPRERCIAAAEGELRIVERLIAETEADIERGYAVETRLELRTRLAACPWPDTVATAPRLCPRNEPVERRVPVAIDRDVAAGQLATLRARRAELRAPTALAVQRCVAAHPG